MAAVSDRSLRAMRWVLVGLLALGTVWAAPQATASGRVPNRCVPGLHVVTTAAANGASGAVATAPDRHHTTRVVDAAASAPEAPAQHGVSTVTEPAAYEQVPASAPAYAPGPRAPPVEGLV